MASTCCSSAERCLPASLKLRPLLDRVRGAGADLARVDDLAPGLFLHDACERFRRIGRRVAGRDAQPAADVEAEVGADHVHVAVDVELARAALLGAQDEAGRLAVLPLAR